MEPWHSLSAAETLDRTDSRRGGLSAREAARRLERDGRNVLQAAKRPPVWLRFFLQFKDPMILVLLAGAGLSLAASGGEDWLDAAIILLIVVVNAVISISQEDSAHRALEALRDMTAPKALVLRDGRSVRIPAEELVVGDVLVLEAGDQIPADARILEGTGLRADESAMTGESAPVAKRGEGVLPRDTPLADRTNLLLSATLLTAGRCTAVVVATGMDTEVGRIAGLLLNQEEGETPLQKKMEEISKTLSFLCLCVCAILFGVGLIAGKNLVDMFLTAVSLAVAAIPEGLPAIVTIVLAMGVGKMAKRGAIVKKLPAVETLGCASVICSDKTGTLTQNKMTVTEVHTLNPEDKVAALTIAALCSDAALRPNGTAVGDPTEAALVLAAAKEGLDKGEMEKEHPRKRELPFDSERKRMSTLHPQGDGTFRLLVKGAPDVLLGRCDRALDRREVPMTDALRRRLGAANEEMAGRALRVLAMAYKDYPADPGVLTPEDENGLVFAGLIGMMDPPRPEVKRAVERCGGAGIRPIMITGDHKLTAVAIARELGIFRPGDRAITGAELDFLPQQVLEEDVERFSVFARVTPEHKMRIVRALQKKGRVAAMTGDGVNDAPALKAADIGCAMGKSGTDVAKSAADLILTDDNFSTIVAAVEEGRGIYSNIKKAIHYLLSCNIGEILTIFLATLLGLEQMPLIPVQLLWLNLVTDSLPALALGVEPVEEGVMERPPRPAGESLFAGGFAFRLAWQGVMVGLLTLAAYFLGGYVLDGRGPAAANTMAFATLTLCQLFHAFDVRSEGDSLFHIGLFSNRAMNKAFLAGLAMQLAVLCLPPFMAVFSVTALTARQWCAVWVLSLAPLVICEGEKAWRRRKARREEEKAAGPAPGRPHARL